MTRPHWTSTPRRLVLAPLAGLSARPAVAAAATAGGCRLPGLVTTQPPRSCTITDGPQPDGLISGAAQTVSHALFDSFGGWLVRASGQALRITAQLVDESTRPALQSTWFSATYWRVAEVATLLTVPFLCAAAAHALVRTDLALLARAAFGYLPLSGLAVAVAAPLTTLALAASDQMSDVVAGAAGSSPGSFLQNAASHITAGASGTGFVVVCLAILTVVAAVALWIELLVRGAAVDVIVLMLPLFFAAMVWPARRVWAIRAIETLIALILAKFAIVAVLALGGAAIAATGAGPVSLLTGATLVLLAVSSPWALLRILPLHEVAAAAAGGLSQGPRRLGSRPASPPQDASPSGGDGPREGDAADAAATTVREGFDPLPDAAATIVNRARAAVGGVARFAAARGGEDGESPGGEDARSSIPDLGSLASPGGARDPAPPSTDDGSAPGASGPRPGSEDAYGLLGGWAPERPLTLNDDGEDRMEQLGPIDPPPQAPSPPDAPPPISPPQVEPRRDDADPEDDVP